MTKVKGAGIFSFLIKNQKGDNTASMMSLPSPDAGHTALSATVYTIGDQADSDDLRMIVSESEEGVILMYQFSLGAAKTAELINGFVRSHAPGIRRGDLVSIVAGGKRDTNTGNGLLVWNGHSVEDLATVADACGHVSARFPVISEFPIGYWQSVIVHNDLVPFQHRQYLGSLTLRKVEGTPLTSGDPDVASRLPLVPFYVWPVDDRHSVCFLSQENDLNEPLIRDLLNSEDVLFCHLSQNLFAEPLIDSPDNQRLYVRMPYRLSGVDTSQVYRRPPTGEGDDQSTETDSDDTDESSDYATEYVGIMPRMLD